MLKARFVRLQICRINVKNMAVEIITREDLAEFRKLLLEDIKLFLPPPQTKVQKDWLRSSEVRALLKISPATLQNFRLNGTLRFAKIGGIHFYKYEDIVKLLESHFVKA